MRMCVPHATSFVVALSELIELLATRADLPAIQQVFASLCLFAAEGGIEITDAGETLHANDFRLPASSRDSLLLVESMRWHGVAALDVDWSAEPEDLLHLARLLSERPSSTELAEDPFDSRAHRAGCWHVVVRMDAAAKPLRDPAFTGEFESVHPAVVLAEGCASVGQALGLAEMIIAHARDLEATGDSVEFLRLLRDVFRAESALEGTRGSATEIRKVWSVTFDRIATPTGLDLVAQHLQPRGPTEPAVLKVLARAGDTAAAVLIRRLLAARALAERRVLYDTIVHVRGGFSVLVRCLEDTRWQVVRNAALLLGAMRARNVERVLTRTLKHSDARVRLAVVTALSEIASFSALALVETAMTDRDSAVRLRAFRSLHARTDYQIGAQSIADALDIERNADTQIDLLQALVQVPETNIVPKLMHFCTPGTHRSFSPDVRMALLEALVRLRPTPAKPLLRLACHDHDPKIREQALRLAG